MVQEFRERKKNKKKRKRRLLVSAVVYAKHLPILRACAASHYSFNNVLNFFRLVAYLVLEYSCSFLIFRYFDSFIPEKSIYKISISCRGSCCYYHLSSHDLGMRSKTHKKFSLNDSRLHRFFFFFFLVFFFFHRQHLLNLQKAL